MQLRYCSILILILSFSCQEKGKGQENAGLLVQNPALNGAVQKANQLISSGQIEHGIKLLDSLATAGQADFRVWSILGRAYSRNQNYDSSILAFNEALKIQPEHAPTHYWLGNVNALKKSNDEAFKHLIRAKELGFNTINISNSPANATLKEDPRYEKLFPSMEEFKNPFLENVRIIHDWVGENERDQFGWIARNAGDMDGDGINDVVTSSPTHGAGKIYTFSGKTGELLWSVAGDTPGGWLGMGVEGAGDVNGDGIPDVIAGTPFDHVAYVYSGVDGSVIHTLQSSDSTGGFGLNVKGIGDVDKDGYGDFLISEPYQVFGGPVKSQQVSHAGKAHLYSGKKAEIIKTWVGENVGDAFGTTAVGKVTSDGFIIAIGAPNAGVNNGGRVYVYKELTNTPAFTIEAESTGRSLGGMFMSIVGDVNGDGVQDVYASDWSDAVLGNNTGRIYVHSGKDGSRLHMLTGESSGDGFGIGVADAGDVNKDGYDDLVIGAWQHATGAPSGGAVYVYSGKDGKLMRKITDRVMGETFGFDATGLGDVDGDGTVDYLLTSAYSSINGFRSGRVLVVSGK